MNLDVRDLLVGAAFFLSFPAAINLTHMASSEAGSPGEPPRAPVTVSRDSWN